MYRLFRAPRGLRGKLFKLTGPIFLETLLMLTLGVVDTLMLSHHSDNAVAAVGVVNQLLNMVFLLFNITTTGTSVMCALYFGAKDHKSFIQVLGTSLLFNAGIGCLISLMLFLFGREMLVLMDIRPDLMPDAATYMHIVGGFGFFQAVSFTISAVLRAANKPNYAMQVTLLINVLNVFGNYALIFGHFGFPALGVRSGYLYLCLPGSGDDTFVYHAVQAVGASYPFGLFPSVPVSEVERRVEDRFAFGSGTNLV